MISRAVAFALAVAALLFAIGPSQADDYPSRTVTIIVPYPAGGPTDELARVLSQYLTNSLKQTFVVENVTGGGTIIGTSKVVRATPDGYTLLLHNLQISANVTLYKKLPFDTEMDLTPVIFVNQNPLVLVGRKSLEANSLQDLLKLMQEKRLKAALPGYGATGHLATALVAQEDKAKVDMIPYRGAAPALQDILGEHVDIFFATPQSVVQQVAAGNMKAFGITSKQKSAQFPNVDSFVSALGPKLEIVYWQALFAPAGTPQPIIDKLNAAVQQAMDDPTINKTWAAEGVSGFPKDQRSVAAARTILKSEIARWGEVIKANNIHVDQ